MSTPIPTRLKQHIRDQIVAEDAPLASTIKQLSVLLGYAVIFDPEWGMLWITLAPHYPDQSTFIPHMVSMLTQWCHAFTAWLEEDKNEEAVERLLDELKGRGSLEIVLEIAPSQTTRPTTFWRHTTRTFVVAIPQARPTTAQTTLAGFSSDLLTAFTTSPSQLPLMVSSPLDPDPDWAELSLESPAFRPLGASSSTSHAAAPRGRYQEVTAPTRATTDVGPDEPLPNLGMLERPEELCQRPPYRLIVRQEGKQRVEVQGSHQGSLKVIEGYLRRWVRTSTDFVNRPPLASITLRESVYGLGLLYDTLLIDAGRGRDVNVLLVLLLVENVLGYEAVDGKKGAGAGAAGGVWEFTRLRGFC